METKNEIFSQRLIWAVLWNFGLQTLVAIFLVFTIQINVLQPVTWISSTIQDIFGWKMSLCIILLGMVSFFQAYIYGSYYMVPPPKYFTRFSMFINMFTVQNITFCLLYALSGYFTMTLYSSLAKSNYNILKKKCEYSDGLCLAEHSLFLQFGGMWMGLYYFTSIYILGSNILLFPHVYQTKFHQIKLSISHIVSRGFQKSITPVVYYCVVYFIWGNRPRSFVSDLYSLYLEDPPLDNLVNLIGSGIWIGLWFYSSLFFISVYIMKTVFNIVLTEPMMFPIESDSALTLGNALALKSQFTGYLGAQDLRLLSMTDPRRRLQVFSLSQPGGHPKNWNSILENGLAIINEFNTELEKINAETNLSELNKSHRPIMGVIPPVTGYSHSSNMRNMAHSPKLYELKDYNKNKAEDTLAIAAKNELLVFFNRLCQKPGISYFFGELTDTKLKFLLIQSQPVMWTCEGLAFIAASSLKEDKYGVVQNDLPVIISSLLKLKHNLDKLTRLGIVPRKNILNDIHAIKIKSALMSAIKRSIYKIVITFSKYINEIPLDPEVQAAIQPFLLCKEA